MQSVVSAATGTPRSDYSALCSSAFSSVRSARGGNGVLDGTPTPKLVEHVLGERLLRFDELSGRHELGQRLAVAGQIDVVLLGKPGEIGRTVHVGHERDANASGTEPTSNRVTLEARETAREKQCFTDG